MTGSVSPAEDFTITVLNGTYASIKGYTGVGGMVVIPSEIDGYIIQSIADSAFRGNTSITGVVLPDTVETIGGYAFYGCTALTHGGLGSGLTTIGSNAFQGCTSLASITVPGTTTLINSSAFSGCKALADVDLPVGLLTIGYYAFSGCTALESIDIPDSVTKLYSRAFENCTSLSEVGYPANWTTVNSSETPFLGCKALTSVTVDEGVTALPANAFVGMSWLTDVRLPDSLRSIGGSAFKGCTGLKEITLPGQLTSMGTYAFSGCTGLTEVTVPAGVVSLSNYVFSGCTSLTSLHLSEGLKAIYAYALSGCTALEAIDIPDSVTTLGMRAFQNCRALTDVGFPASWTYVADAGNALPESNASNAAFQSPFDGCTALKQITVDAPITVLPQFAFNNLPFVDTVTLPDTVTSIGAFAFYNCTALKSVSMPDCITSIGRYAFCQCTSLRAMYAPAELLSLGDLAFYGCTGLMYIRLSDVLETIGNWAFQRCTELRMIRIPDSVKTLNQSLFDDCSRLTSVTLPRSLERISSSVFRNCSNLHSLKVPDTVTSISSTAFNGVTDLTFYCNLYTYAATYAIDNKIPIVDLGENIQIESAALDREKSFYKVNYDGISASGYLSMAADYAFKSADGVSGVTLTFNIPTTAKLIEKTIYVDGVLCTNYTYSNNVLTIPGRAAGGSIRFSLEPLSYDKVTAYAKISFRDASGSRTEVLGTVYTELPILSITTRGETGITEAEVSGVTIPGQQVTLSVNGTVQKTVTANKAGDYFAVLDLGSPSNGKACTLGASITYNGETITAEAVTYYRIGSPTITKFIMEHSGQNFDMIGKNGIKPIVTFSTGRPFRFTVQFDSAEYIRSVYIVSTRNNIRKTMRVEWNEEEQAFIASGFFDPGNTSYVPGVITVEYINTGDKISFDTEYDFTSEEMINSVPKQWADAEVEIKENTETKVSIKLKETENGDIFDLKVEYVQIPEGLTEENAKENQYTPITDDYGNKVYVKYSQEPKGNTYDAKYEIVQFTGEEISKKAVEFSIRYVTNKAIGEVAGTVMDLASLYNDVKEVGADFYKYQYAYEDMIDTIRRSNLDEKTKDQAIHRLETAIVFNNLAFLGRIVGNTANFFSIFMSNKIISFFVNIGLKGTDMLYDYALNEIYYQMEKMMYDLFACEFTFRWVIDPSGYVYNAQSGNRLPGVTTTAYWIPLEDGDDETEFFEQTPSADEYGEMWDAFEYSQENPLLTDDEGRYAWNVPNGWWRVSYEKDGYETTWSDWLPVPPPQTNVNIAMTPTNERIRGSVTSYTASEEIVLALYASD
ncbi:MAG: leucine-rich repeat domain-containing protein, partial [Clostridia bacterium]|nr:leucine-rich repeat domain-containing protein [Clostridia bacterium]